MENKNKTGIVCEVCGYLHGCHKVDCSVVNEVKKKMEIKLTKKEKEWLESMLKAHLIHIWGNKEDMKMCKSIGGKL